MTDVLCIWSQASYYIYTFIPREVEAGKHDVDAREDGMEKISLEIVHLPWEVSR